MRFNSGFKGLNSVHFGPQKILCYQMLIFLFAVWCVMCHLCTIYDGPVKTTYDKKQFSRNAEGDFCLAYVTMCGKLNGAGRLAVGKRFVLRVGTMQSL